MTKGIQAAEWTYARKAERGPSNNAKHEAQRRAEPLRDCLLEPRECLLPASAMSKSAKRDRVLASFFRKATKEFAPCINDSGRFLTPGFQPPLGASHSERPSDNWHARAASSCLGPALSSYFFSCFIIRQKTSSFSLPSPSQTNSMRTVRIQKKPRRKRKLIFRRFPRPRRSTENTSNVTASESDFILLKPL